MKLVKGERGPHVLNQGTQRGHKMICEHKIAEDCREVHWQLSELTGAPEAQPSRQSANVAHNP